MFNAGEVVAAVFHAPRSLMVMSSAIPTSPAQGDGRLEIFGLIAVARFLDEDNWHSLRERPHRLWLQIFTTIIDRKNPPDMSSDLIHAVLASDTFATEQCPNENYRLRDYTAQYKESHLAFLTCLMQASNQLDADETGGKVQVQLQSGPQQSSLYRCHFSRNKGNRRGKDVCSRADGPVKHMAQDTQDQTDVVLHAY